MDSDSTQEQIKSPRIFLVSCWAPWIFAILFAAICAWQTQVQFSARTENARLRELSTLGEYELRSLRQEIEAERLISSRQLVMQGDLEQVEISMLGPVCDTTSAPHGAAVWQQSQHSGVIRIYNLPELSAAQDFQIWVTYATKPKPVSGGVFHPVGATARENIWIEPLTSTKRITGISITIERKGGAAEPSGAVVVSNH